MTAKNPALSALVDSLGLTYAAKFVPQSQSRNKAEKPCLNWTVSITKGSVTLKTDYMQGIGHLKGFKHGDRSLDYSNAVKSAVESGKWNPAKTGNMMFYSGATIPAPDVLDVLACLVLDSDVSNYGDFEEWAENMGYETDSRKAEKIYNECMASWLKLRQIIGYDNLKALQVAFQDY